jgi:hypothetical protein
MRKTFRTQLYSLPGNAPRAVDSVAASAMTAEADTRRALDYIRRDLESINPSATRNLEEV